MDEVPLLSRAEINCVREEQVAVSLYDKIWNIRWVLNSTHAATSKSSKSAASGPLLVKYKGVLWTSPPMCIPQHVVTVQACVLLSTVLPGMQTLAYMLCSQAGPLGPAVFTSNWAGTCAALIATPPPAPMKLQCFRGQSR